MHPQLRPFSLLIVMLFYFTSILCLIGLFLYHLSNPEPCQCAVFPVVLAHCAYVLSSITNISISSLNALISGFLRLNSTYPV